MDADAPPHLPRPPSRPTSQSLLDHYAALGIENILALGGDPPAGGVEEPGDYLYAMDLLDDVVATGSFAIGVAAHPEVHPRSPDRATDRRHLADKLAVADFALTQFFFEVEHWVRLVDELSALGVDKPVLPGIMPINNKAMVKRMAEMSGAALPGWLADRLDGTDDPDGGAPHRHRRRHAALCADLHRRRDAGSAPLRAQPTRVGRGDLH